MIGTDITAGSAGTAGWRWAGAWDSWIDFDNVRITTTD